MSISNYSELKQAVANWLERDDLTNRIPEFIELAEYDAAAKLRVREMEAQDTTINTVAGTEFYDLPARYLETRSVHLDRNPLRTLKYVSPEQYKKDYSSTSNGEPKVFTIIGTQIGFRPVPDSADNVQLDPLNTGSETNWYTDNAPQILLYGALYHASIYLVDNERVAAFKAIFEQMIDQFNDSEAGGRWSGSHKSIRTTSNP